MRRKQQRPIALTIAGSDSGGGAGIQADLKTFAALGVHGTCAITCVTAQNPREVLAIHGCPAEISRAQIQAVFAEVPPAAVKTGMLYSADVVGVIVRWFKGNARPPLVVDPVMAASSGASLVKRSSMQPFWDELLPLAKLVTPNLNEASVLIGGAKLESVEDMRHAARQIRAQFGCAVLVKGGHLQGVRQAVDVFYDGESEFLLEAPFVRGVSTHGTGCTYSAAITAYLARRYSLARSVALAKHYITQAIAQSYGVSTHQALNSFWKGRLC